MTADSCSGIHHTIAYLLNLFCWGVWSCSDSFKDSYNVNSEFWYVQFILKYLESWVLSALISTPCPCTFNQTRHQKSFPLFVRPKAKGTRDSPCCVVQQQQKPQESDPRRNRNAVIRAARCTTPFFGDPRPVLLQRVVSPRLPWKTLWSQCWADIGRSFFFIGARRFCSVLLLHLFHPLRAVNLL